MTRKLSDTQRLGSAFAIIGKGLETGEIPIELLERFATSPYRLLEPLEVWPTQFGGLIPKNVDADSVHIVFDPDTEQHIAIGVRMDGTFWSSVPRVPNVPLDDHPFIISDGRLSGAVRRNGWVYDVKGRRIGNKLLSKSPFIAWDSDLSCIVTDRHIAQVGSRMVDPVGGTMVSDTNIPCLWTAAGRIWIEPNQTFSFEFQPGQRIQSVSVNGNTTAFVFAIPGKEPYSQLVVLRNDEINAQTMGVSISRPIIREDGTVFVQVNGTLLKIPPNRRNTSETVCLTDNDPWMTKEGVICVLVEEGLFQVFQDDYEVVTKYQKSISANGSIFWTAFNRTSGVEVRKVYGNGSIGHEAVLEDVAHEGIDSLVTGDDYALSCRVCTDKGAQRMLSVVKCYDHPQANGRWFIIADDNVYFDLHQVMVKGTRVYAVAQMPTSAGMRWRVVMNGLHDKMIVLGTTSADAISNLRIEGSLLRWHQRKDRDIIECRMYVGE